MSKHLYWSEYYLFIHAKVGILAIFQFRLHLTDKTILSGILIYIALFLPYISYCYEVWGKCLQNNHRVYLFATKKSSENCLQCWILKTH